MELVRLVQIVYRRCRMASSVITCTQCSIVIKTDWSLLSCYVHLYLYNKNYIETFQAVAMTSVSVGMTFTVISKVTHDNVLLYLVVHSLTPKFPSFIPSTSFGMYPWPFDSPCMHNKVWWASRFSTASFVLLHQDINVHIFRYYKPLEYNYLHLWTSAKL